MYRFVLSFVVFGLTLSAGPLLTINSICHGDPCGTLSVTMYEEFLDFTDLNGGVTIKASWNALKPGKYHFLSAVLKDTAPPNYTDGSTLPIPYADTPPGGYQGSKGKINDYLPWYPFEGGTWPDKTFEDQPFNSFYSVVTLDNNDKVIASRDVHVFFETWLICVIQQKGEVDPEKGPAKSASYKVSPLAGFTWGFTLSWADKNGDNIAQLGEFTSTKKALLNAGKAPSADMVKAFSKATKYGAGAQQDFFDVDMTGDCKACFVVVPEPVSISYMFLGAGLIVIRQLRRLKMPA